MDKDCYTTTEAARVLSVSADTVLKWVKAGKIESYRTPGGHSRIPKEAVTALLPNGKKTPELLEAENTTEVFKYCWEFHTEDGIVNEECHSCVAFKSRAHRCYEMRNIPGEFGVLKLHCRTDCDECDYFRMKNGQALSVLIVSRSANYNRSLRKQAEESQLAFEFVSSEYELAAIIDKFRPDYVVVDCSFGQSRTRDICQHLVQDDRIPLTRIVLSSKQASKRDYCDNEAFGWITKPFTISQFENLVEETAQH